MWQNDIPLTLRVLLIAASLIVVIVVVHSSRKARMNVKYAILWIVWSALLLIIALWPQLAFYAAKSFGFASVTNFVLVVMVGLLFMFNYYTYLKMSHMAKEINDLNYELALLRKKDDEKNNDKK